MTGGDARALSGADFKAHVSAAQPNMKIFRLSALGIRDGGGVFERVLGGRNYRTALEIGTYRGVTAAFMAQFCERVITIDLKRGLVEKNGGSFDRQAFWRSLGIDNIELRLVENDAEKAEIIASLDFDFAFVDGDHQGNAPAFDFELVRRCGTVLFHDCDRNNGVVALVKSLPKKQVTHMDIFALWQANG